MPRIIIITSVFFGLLVIAVLIGMNFNKTGNEKDIFAGDNNLYDNLLAEREKSDPFDKNMIDPSAGSDDPGFKTPENVIADIPVHDKSASGKISNEPVVSPDNILKSGNSLFTANEKDKQSGVSDILTHENIESIIPPSKIMKKTTPGKKASLKQKPVKTQKSSRKKNVVEVSSTEKIFKTPDPEKDYFAVQVASFDNKTKAMNEIGRLEQQKYNAFIDSALVKGKKYYRVRIGPIYSRKKACNLLDEISANNRYEESYIIKN